MSSTGRVAERIDADYYPTPAWCVRRLLDRVDLPGGLWLEPSAGDGAIIRAAGRADVQWTAVELRQEACHRLTQLAAEVIVADFMPTAATFAVEGRRFDVAILNPPFSHAQAFVELCLQLADHVVALERLNWIGGPRAHRFRGQMPNINVLPNRPSFTGTGTDSIEYAWFHWRSALRVRTGLVQMLDDTPIAERRAGDLEPSRQPALFDLGAR